MQKQLFQILVLCLVFCAGTVSAQIGFKGGINLVSLAQEGTNISASDLKTNSGIGGVAGITFDLDLSDVFTIQPEFLFIQKGGKDEFRFFGTRTEQITLINYFEIPVMAKVVFGNSGNDGGLGLYVAAGPWMGYALNGRVKYSTFGNDGSFIESYTDTFTFDNKDDRKRLDWGASGGVGLVLGRLIIEGRYNYGINNLLDEDANNNNDNAPVLQTRGLSITLGVVF
jgi:hypothetical protein